MKMPRIINIIFLQGLLDQLKFMVMLALTRLGMLNPTEQAESEDPASGLVLVIMDGLSPSLIPVQSLMVLIKKRVPVIEYSNFLERYGVMHDEDVDMECSVCLNCVERSHEIRELCNCYHVFHKECLDRWVDEGQVTCPLCRTIMFPAKDRKDNLDSERNLWML
ncbi:e3 ubiquitin-protein ligase rha1b [Quercus suber]|uniref:E3 ubiquitin-protein ligase rha1b n=1 Tax=Quercus suber TaxID=58331 RepID=A0AAW0KD85_QUESU|nr:putative ring finger protein p4h10.07 [Quercus suber]